MIFAHGPAQGFKIIQVHTSGPRMTYRVSLGLAILFPGGAERRKFERGTFLGTTLSNMDLIESGVVV